MQFYPAPPPTHPQTHSTENCLETIPENLRREETGYNLFTDKEKSGVLCLYPAVTVTQVAGPCQALICYLCACK